MLAIIGLVIYVQQQDEAPSNSSSNCIVSAGVRSCTEDYEGLNMREATDKAHKNKLTAKIREMDGDRDVINTDLGGTPIYFTINNDTVTKAELN